MASRGLPARLTPRLPAVPGRRECAHPPATAHPGRGRLPLGLLAALLLPWPSPSLRASDSPSPSPAAPVSPDTSTRTNPGTHEVTTDPQETLRAALIARDLNRIRGAVDLLRTALGRDAGVPEFPTLHHPPPDGTPFPPSRAWAYADRELARIEDRLPWRANPTADPERMDEGLRAIASPVRFLSVLARIDPGSRPFALSLAREGADLLLRLQHPTGLFPYPVGPARGNARSASGAAAARLLLEHPEALEGHWIVEDGGDGGLQFDTGLCGIALLEAHAACGHAPYLEAARRAAAWIRSRPLSANWNYNAFGISLLARLHQTTGAPDLLVPLLERLHLGVIPGQLPDGRWVDRHNARLVYHNILLRALLDVEATLPRGHEGLGSVQQALGLATAHAVRVTLQKGYAGTFIDTLARLAARPDSDPEVRRALDIALNAALGERHRAPAPGEAIVDYLATLPPRHP